MTVETGGERRGLVARWLMRLEAAGNILRMGFLGVTAASTLTSALALVGYQSLAPYVLVMGIAGTLGFAFAYVEYGIYNRKNRERADRGQNFAGPTMRIDDEMIARAIMAGLHGRELTDKERDAIKVEADSTYSEYRNGVSLGDG